MLENNYKNWDISIDKDSLIWLGFDLENKSANILTKEALNELEIIIKKINQLSDYKGLIIYSKKDSGFIFGADVLSFINYSNDQIEKLLIQGQRIYREIEKINNTVCMIKGLCLGGGLELALACNYRVISTDAKLGLPDLKEISGMAGKLVKDVKQSVTEIVSEYKTKHKNEESKPEEQSNTASDKDTVKAEEKSDTSVEEKPAEEKSDTSTEEKPAEEKPSEEDKK